MTLDDFIEKFLPNYEEKWNKKNREFSSGNMYFWTRLQFVTDHFEEALQNFMSKICEKQKELCANDVYLYVSMNSNPDPEDLREIINGSFNPRIYELWELKK